MGKENIAMLIDREITIKFAPREDGGLRVWSDDLPGLILSHSNQRLVLRDIGDVIAALCMHKQGKSAAALEKPE